jgi:HAE1 family hydrophobic/amphiphilic exporter-1
LSRLLRILAERAYEYPPVFYPACGDDHAGDGGAFRFRLGSTQVTIQFELNRSIDAAAQDVQSAISAAARQLPVGMPAPPSYQKVNPADQPIMYISLSSPTLPLSTVDDYAETNMAQRISTIDGVAQVSVFGSQKYVVRVQVDPDALAARGIGIDQVENAVAQSNVNLPTGTLWANIKRSRLKPPAN